jgi:hypothetical protein
LANLNFNPSFNQTYIFPNQPQLKVLFIKQLFQTTTTTAAAMPNKRGVVSNGMHKIF